MLPYGRQLVKLPFSVLHISDDLLKKKSELFEESEKEHYIAIRD